MNKPKILNIVIAFIIAIPSQSFVLSLAATFYGKPIVCGALPLFYDRLDPILNTSGKIVGYIEMPIDCWLSLEDLIIRGLTYLILVVGWYFVIRFLLRRFLHD